MLVSPHAHATGETQGQLFVKLVPVPNKDRSEAGSSLSLAKKGAAGEDKDKPEEELFFEYVGCAS